MPFLKPNAKQEPKWKRLNRLSQLNGLQHAVFDLQGNKYIGDWKDDLKHGKGSRHYVKNVLYEGDWSYDWKHGYGCLSLKKKNGEYNREYAGDWCWGKRCGYGYRYYRDGGFYEGEWSEDKRSGHGRMWYPDGSFYEGDWFDDKRDGEGLYIQANFNRYEGEWWDDMKHGHGKFYHLDSGQLQEGIWVRDIASCSKMTDIQYRQAALWPTPYPIQVNKLEDSEGVYKEAENHFLEKVDEEIEEKHI